MVFKAARVKGGVKLKSATNRLKDGCLLGAPGVKGFVACSLYTLIESNNLMCKGQL